MNEMVAARAAGGITIHGLDSVAEIQAARDIWHRVWERSGEPPITTDLLRALAHSGNYVSGAFVGGEMVGALLGFYGGADAPDHLHSHILGVTSSNRARGVGYALKLHQRDWVLEHGLRRITWTFDPLVRMNGYFNIAKLGARGIEYFVNFYGEMPDAINGGDQSDRVLVEWALDSERVRAVLAEGASAPEAGSRKDAEVALEAGPDGLPVRRESSADRLLAQVPEDIVALRRSNPAAARAWRVALREVFAAGLGRGLEVTGMNRAGWYEVGPPS